MTAAGAVGRPGGGRSRFRTESGISRMRKSSYPNGLPQYAREETERRDRVFPANEAIEGVAAALFAELLGLAAQRRRAFPYN